MENIKFLEDIHNYLPEHSFIMELSKGIRDEDELFSEFNDKLNFPDYFGYNWNALYDLLRDFHWMNEKGIVIIHQDIPLFEDEERRNYLNVLFDASQDWKEGEEHYLQLVFPKEIESQVRGYLDV